MGDPSPHMLDLGRGRRGRRLGVVARHSQLPRHAGGTMTGKKLKALPGGASRKIVETRTLMDKLLAHAATVSQDHASGSLAALRADFKAYTKRTRLRAGQRPNTREV